VVGLGDVVFGVDECVCCWFEVLVRVVGGEDHGFGGEQFYCVVVDVVCDCAVTFVLFVLYQFGDELFFVVVDLFVVVED